MSVLVLWEVTVKNEHVDNLSDFMKRELHFTRGFDGCNGLTVHSNKDDHNNIVVVQHWDSKENYKSYLDWRMDRGDGKKMENWFVNEPKIRYFDNQRL